MVVCLPIVQSKETKSYANPIRLKIIKYKLVRLFLVMLIQSQIRIYKEVLYFETIINYSRSY